MIVEYRVGIAVDQRRAAAPGYGKGAVKFGQLLVALLEYHVEGKVIVEAEQGDQVIREHVIVNGGVQIARSGLRAIRPRIRGKSPRRIHEHENFIDLSRQQRHDTQIIDVTTIAMGILDRCLWCLPVRYRPVFELGESEVIPLETQQDLLWRRATGSNHVRQRKTVFLFSAVGCRYESLGVFHLVFKKGRVVPEGLEITAANPKIPFTFPVTARIIDTPAIGQSLFLAAANRFFLFTRLSSF